MWYSMRHTPSTKTIKLGGSLMVIRSSRKSDPRRSQKALIKKDRIIQLDLAFSLVAAAPQTEVSEWVWWVFCFCFFLSLLCRFLLSIHCFRVRLWERWWNMGKECGRNECSCGESSSAEYHWRDSVSVPRFGKRIDCNSGHISTFTLCCFRNSCKRRIR